MTATATLSTAEELAVLRRYQQPDRSAELERGWKANVVELLATANRIADGHKALDVELMLALLQNVMTCEQGIGRNMGGVCVAALVEELPLRFLRFRRAGRSYIASLEAGGDQIDARRQFKNACDDFIEWAARIIRRQEIDPASGVLSLTGVDPWTQWPLKKNADQNASAGG